LRPLRELLSLAPSEFRARDESLNYAAARYFCKFAEERDALRRMYRLARDHHADDPRGMGAVLRALGAATIDEVDVAWRAWLLTQAWDGCAQ
jgi:hypothetical protein